LHVIAGRLFLLIKEKIGYVTSSLCHMGADWAVLTIVYLIVYYININKKMPISGIDIS
jgi:hypothetical protein